MTTAVLDRLDAAVRLRLAPPPDVSVSEWCDEHRILSQESSASPGRWQTLPYQRGIMDALRDPAVETIVFCKASQIGATEALISMLLYEVACDPGPSMALLPTLAPIGE